MHLKRSSTVLLLALLVPIGVFVAGCGGGGGGQSEEQQGGAPREQGGKEDKGPAAERKIALGKVAVVDPDNEKIILNEARGGRISFKFKDSTRVTLDGKETEMSGVKEGQQAQVEYVVRNERNRAREVSVFSSG